MSADAGRLPAGLVAGPAALISLGAVITLALGLVAAGRHPGRAAQTFATHASFALQLFLAAGIIRLAALGTLRAYATVLSIVLLRQIVARGVRFGSQAASAEALPRAPGR